MTDGNVIQCLHSLFSLFVIAGFSFGCPAYKLFTLSPSHRRTLDAARELVIEGESAVVDADDLPALRVLNDTYDRPGREAEASQVLARGVGAADAHDARRFADLEERQWHFVTPCFRRQLC